MDVLEASQFPRYSAREPAVQAQVYVGVVHILERSSRRLFSEIDEIEGSVTRVADDGKPSAGNTAMVHANDADAEDGSDHGVGGISLSEEDLGTDFAALRILGGDCTVGA